jgi:hypothetical protein
MINTVALPLRGSAAPAGDDGGVRANASGLGRGAVRRSRRGADRRGFGAQAEWAWEVLGWVAEDPRPPPVRARCGRIRMKPGEM